MRLTIYERVERDMVGAGLEGPVRTGREVANLPGRRPAGPGEFIRLNPTGSECSIFFKPNPSQLITFNMRLTIYERAAHPKAALKRPYPRRFARVKAGGGLWAVGWRWESARGLAQSKTLARWPGGGRFVSRGWMNAFRPLPRGLAEGCRARADCPATAEWRWAGAGSRENMKITKQTHFKNAWIAW